MDTKEEIKIRAVKCYFPNGFDRNEPKLCKFCNTERKLEDFHFRKEIKRFRVCCKICYKNKVKKPIVKQKDIDLERGEKTCRCCGETKTIKNFFYSKTKAVFVAQCQECWSKKKLSYIKTRKKTDTVFKLSQKVKTSIYNYLKTQNCKKTSRTKDILGCDAGFYKEYLENQFVSKMSWENWGYKPGYWSIDHIYPVQLFDLSQEGQVKLAFNWKNTRPVWFEENSSKSDWLEDIGRRARDLTREEKVNYLISSGFDVKMPPKSSEDSGG